MLQNVRTCTDSLDKQPTIGRTSKWKVMSLYREGSPIRVAREMSEYNLHSVRVQEGKMGQKWQRTNGRLHIFP